MEKVVLAYSGGLDTSFCIPYLREIGFEVVTVTADTGGFDAEELAALEGRSRSLGAIEHKTLDCKQKFYDRVISYIIKGNILKGNVYPLCVGAERGIQAEALVEVAQAIGARTVAHGCTGAGNDQVRFDVSVASLDSSLKIIAPIRELKLSREEESRRLKSWGYDFPAKKTKYSINHGLLGTTIGGGETHNSWEKIPEDAWVMTRDFVSQKKPDIESSIYFESGLPVKFSNSEAQIDGNGLKILQKLNEQASVRGIGRGIHLGDTILGIKGRIAFEAPGISVLISAHRELEKLVLTKLQTNTKEQMASLYGQLLHEGHYFNPVMKDIEAFFDSSQQFVTGEVRVLLRLGNALVDGVRSKNSLMDVRASYGEGTDLWSPADAKGFCRISGIQSMLVGSRTLAKN